MNDYFVDRETLGQFIDALIAQKYQNQPAENLDAIREEAIRNLDDRIGNSIYGDLSEEKMNEVNALFAKNEEDPAVFDEFFKNAGIDVDAKIAEILKAFQAEFLGGQNA